MAISFRSTREERQLMDAIADRARGEYLIKGDPDARLDLIMDLTATHANGCPLDFEKLANSAGPSFRHDILNIRLKLDRDTGKLKDCFVPRCAK